jgi:hypothetical protein
MLRFKHFISEENTTGNLIYFASSGAQFAVDTVGMNFDVEDFENHEPEKKKKMKPWEVENALLANKRREFVLQWMKAAGANTNNSVTDDSLPLTPDWQSEVR